MSLNFPNVELLGLTRDSRFFDAGFNYASNKRLVVQGKVIDLAAGFGITGIWTGVEGMINTVRNNGNYQDLSLNGFSFGSGKIEDISFEAGLDVKTKGYQATLVVQDSGNLFNFTGSYYSGIDSSNFTYLNSFNESYTFNKKLNGGYSLGHNASIQFSSGVGNLNAIQAAQALAITLFTGGNLGFAFYSGYTNRQGKRYINESYNLIDNSCSFQETFDFDRDLGTYSAVHTKTVEFDAEGVITVTEKGTIRGIENPNFQQALSAITIELTGAYHRCSGAAVAYVPSGSLLLPYPLYQGRALDIFNNTYEYSIAFNNKPGNSGTYFWDYTQQVSREANIGTITENGNVIGRGENRTLAFSAAQAGFAVVKAGIPGRTTSLFTAALGSPTNFLIAKKENYSPFQGQVGYSYAYSNDPALIANSGIRRREVTVSNPVPIYAYNKINIFNYKEIAQNDYQSTKGSATVNVIMEGDKTVGLSDFLAAALPPVSSNQPAGTDVYVSEASYDYSPDNNGSSVRVTWVYHTPAVQTIFP